MNFIIGTRSSQLALYQANAVKNLFESHFPHNSFILKTYHTVGDKILDRPLSAVGDKGMFTAELEEDLLSGNIHFAVHSLKDMKIDLPKELIIASVLPRGEFRDCLVANNVNDFENLSQNDVVATSSLRRKAQILHFHKNISVIDIRGNINSRLKKFSDGYSSALIMAATGLQRLNLQNFISQIIPEDIFIPAACQGIIAVETALHNDIAISMAKQINHKVTFDQSLAERHFLGIIDGGCKTPFGCYTRFSGNEFFIKGFMSMPDGNNFIIDSCSGAINDYYSVVDNLANNLLKKGGGVILKYMQNHDAL